MGELLSALKTGNQAKFEAAFKRSITHASKIKTESSKKDVPSKLRKVWERENREVALRDGELPKNARTHIPKSLRDRWQKEDAERALEE